MRPDVRPGRPPVAHVRLLAAAVACVTCAFVLCTSAAAETYQRDRTPLPKLAGAGSGSVHASAGGAFARLGIGLMLVIAVIFGIYWVIKRSSRGRKQTASGNLNIVATAPLGPNRAVHLLRVGNDLVLVGSAEGGVRPIRFYKGDDAEALAQALDPADPFGRAPAPRGNFLDELRRRTAR